LRPWQTQHFAVNIVTERAGFNPSTNDLYLGATQLRCSEWHFSRRDHGEYQALGRLPRNDRGSGLSAFEDIFTRFER
jgi:hypothetical protein